MYIYYDSKGVLKEIVNDDAIRQGNSNFNKIYFFIEGADPQIVNSVYQALLFNNGLRTFIDVEGNNLTTEQFSLITVNKQIPYDKKRELKFFKYFTDYQMFEITVPDEILNESGTVGCRIQMTLPESTIMTLGLLVFNVEFTSIGQAIIQPDTAINIAQWNYLVANMLLKDALNIQNGDGDNAVQQKRDTETVNFTGRNPNAEALDSSLSDTFETGASGVESVALNGNTMAMAKRSMSNGNKTIAKGEESHAEGYQSVTLGDGSHAEGNETVAYGNTSHSEGILTQAMGNESHAEGNQTISYAQWGHTEGVKTIVKDNYLVVDSGDTPSPIPTPTPEPATPEEKDALNGVGAHAEGHSNFTLGLGAHAEGVNNKGYGRFSHTEGGENQSGEIIIRKTENGKDYYTPNQDKQYQHAEGYQTIAKGTASHTGGLGTIANYDFQTVVGKYNDNKVDTLFEVGKGTDDEHRSNALEVLADGRVTIGATPTQSMDVVNKGYVDAVIAGVYKPQGSATVVDLNNLTKTATMNGYVYNMSNGGTLNQYGGGATLSVQAGDNVAFIWNEGIWYWDNMVGFIDTSNLVDKTTDQTITGVKTFSNGLKIGNDMLLSRSSDFNGLEIGNDKNLVLNGTIFPKYSNKDIGTSSYTWQNLYLSGNVNFSGTTTQGILNLANNRWIFRYDYGNGILDTNYSFCPVLGNTYDLGLSYRKWNNVWANTLKGLTTLTQAQYDALVSGGTVDADTLYLIVEE